MALCYHKNKKGKIMSNSKYLLSAAQIERLCQKAFGQSAAAHCELTEGSCNTLYRVTLADGRQVVAKVASVDNRGKVRNEAWLMQSETAAMTLIAQKAPDVPIPRLLFYDDGLTDCPAKYFFMEYIAKPTRYNLRETLSDADKAVVDRQLGALVRRIASITGEGFGILGSPHRFATLFDFLSWFLENNLADMAEKHVDMGLAPDDLRGILTALRPAFDEVTTPAFVHYDIWGSNYCLDGLRVCAILDWERALWGDPLMEERFRNFGKEIEFYRGFGKETFTNNEKKRMLFYDMLIDTSIMAETFTRGSEPTQRFLHAREELCRLAKAFACQQK